MKQIFDSKNTFSKYLSSLNGYPKIDTKEKITLLV